VTIICCRRRTIRYV